MGICVSETKSGTRNSADLPPISPLAAISWVREYQSGGLGVGPLKTAINGSEKDEVETGGVERGAKRPVQHRQGDLCGSGLGALREVQHLLQASRPKMADEFGKCFGGQRRNGGVPMAFGGGEG